MVRHPAVRAAVPAFITGTAFGITFSYRTDYLGHYIAGFGATLGLLSLVYLLPVKARPVVILATVLVAIAIGWGTERTIFRLAIADPVDFFNQSLGAAVAGAVVLGDEAGSSSGLWMFLIGLVAVAVGFYFAFG